MMIMSSWSQGACFDLLFAIKDREQGVAFVKILAQINIRIYSYINVYKYVFSCGEKHCPPPNYWVIGPQHRFCCKTTMLSTKSPDHHVKSGVSGPPAVAVHGVAPAAGLRYFPYGQNMQSI